MRETAHIMRPWGLSLNPDRLKRYKDIARLFYKYGRADLVSHAGLDDALAPEEFAAAGGR